MQSLEDFPKFSLKKSEDYTTYFQEIFDDIPLSNSTNMMEIIFIIFFIAIFIICLLLIVFYIRFKMYCNYVENRKHSKFRFHS